MSVTIRHVAREAGVSVATVSRVLNGSGPVGAETRAQVQAAARALRPVVWKELRRSAKRVG